MVVVGASFDAGEEGGMMDITRGLSFRFERWRQVQLQQVIVASL